MQSQNKYIKVYNWFKEFQGDQDVDKMLELYPKLIEEEIEEYYTARANKDIIGEYDAIIDIVWVCLGYQYFYSLKPDQTDEWYKYSLSLIEIFEIKGGKAFRELLAEISRSNYTKSKEKQEGEKAGKIVKGKTYSPPNIEPILKKYNLM